MQEAARANDEKGSACRSRVNLRDHQIDRHSVAHEQEQVIYADIWRGSEAFRSDG